VTLTPSVKRVKRNPCSRNVRSLNLSCFASNTSPKGPFMARKTIRVSDQSGDDIPEGKGEMVRITFRRRSKGCQGRLTSQTLRPRRCEVGLKLVVAAGFDEDAVVFGAERGSPRRSRAFTGG
jgi:hypothetical protein